MELISFPVTFLQENVYFYYDETTKDTIIVDPGGESKKILNKINDLCLNPKAIILTHGHFDHIGAVISLCQNFDISVFFHQDEMFTLENHDDKKIVDFFSNSEKCIKISDGYNINFSNINLVALHTPGHTPGGCCYYDKTQDLVFTGDTLFFEEVGRCDLEGGDFEKIKKSIKNKLYSLPDKTSVYCGHGPKSTIEHEKKHNPYVKF